MIIEILFVIFMVFWLLTHFPNGPVAGYPWAPHALAFICVLLLGLYLFAPAMR
jgi:hypothetical protein